MQLCERLVTMKRMKDKSIDRLPRAASPDLHNSVRLSEHLQTKYKVYHKQTHQGLEV